MPTKEAVDQIVTVATKTAFLRQQTALSGKSIHQSCISTIAIIKIQLSLHSILSFGQRSQYYKVSGRFHY